MKKTILAAILALTAALAPASASTGPAARADTGPTHAGFWASDVFEWWYSEEGQPEGISTEDAVEVAIAATRRWERLTPIKFKFRGVTRERLDEISMNCGRRVQNVIGWGGIVSSGGDMLAVALTCASGKKTGLDRIERATIIIAADAPEFSSKTALGTLDSVLTHELGHALGLGHASTRASIMYPTVAASSSPLSVHLPMAADGRSMARLYGQEFDQELFDRDQLAPDQREVFATQGPDQKAPLRELLAARPLPKEPAPQKPAPKVASSSPFPWQ